LNELAQVASSARCDTCQTEFEADPDETVEAVFAPHPTLGCAPIERFCTRNPAVAPDVHMVQVLAPGERRQVEVPLSAGIWLLSAGAASEPTELQVRPGEGQAALRWEPGAQLGGAVLREGMLALDLENTGATHERVLLTQPARSEGRVTVSSLASFPTFRRHFGHEGVATDVRLKARHVALLFTDLASSVAFYRSVGDGAAFSFVKSHVDVLRPVLDQHGGAIVKSTGDGLLCAFDDSSAALACALEMMRRYNAYCAEREGESPAMRIGIHAGPTLIVRTSWAPLDYYGMSVNLAARAEGQGAPGDIVWTQAVAQAPGVSEVLEREGLVPSLSSAQVKGLTEPMDFFRVSVGGGR
jgi:class 3 adenylate cyclase